MRTVDVCVNNPDNGIFTGRCVAVSYEAVRWPTSLELAHQSFRGCAIDFIEEDIHAYVKLSRKRFEIIDTRDWFGNWCWMRIYLQTKEARRLIRYLRQMGCWSVDNAPHRLDRWWDNYTPKTRTTNELLHRSPRL